MEHIFKTSTIRRLMKKQLPKDKILHKDAVECLQDTIETIFYEVLTKTKHLPYRNLTGYVVAKECAKYFAKQEKTAAYLTALENIHKQTGEILKTENLTKNLL